MSKELKEGYIKDYISGEIIKATPEEIARYEESTIKILDYNAEKVGSSIKFGCALIPKETIEGLLHFIHIADRSKFDFGYNHSLDEFMINNEIVSRKTFPKLLNKLNSK